MISQIWIIIIIVDDNNITHQLIMVVANNCVCVCECICSAHYYYEKHFSWDTKILRAFEVVDTINMII